MKKTTVLIIVVFILLTFCGCGHKHHFSEATCTTDAVCDCGEIGNKAFDHYFEQGVCRYCSYEDPTFFNPEKYGFITNYGMTKWIEITSYSVDGEKATYKENGYKHKIYEFTNNIFYDYSRYEELSMTKDYNIKETSNYTIINNDCINMNGDTYTITERVKLKNKNLIIKVFVDDSERWFILEEQVDWSKSPIEENTDNISWSSFIYYFK